MKFEVCTSESFEKKKLDRKTCHTVTFAEIGLSVFSALCEFKYDISRETQIACASEVNRKMETGSLYPRANLTILPRPLFRDAEPSRSLMRTCIRDAFIAERDYVKSGMLILEFTCSDVSFDLIHDISKDLSENEFAGDSGSVILLHDQPSTKAELDNYYPHAFIRDCRKYVGTALNTSLETEKNENLLDAIGDRYYASLFMTCLWHVILLDQVLWHGYKQKLAVSDSFFIPVLLSGAIPSLEDPSYAFQLISGRQGANAWEIPHGIMSKWHFIDELVPPIITTLLKTCRQHSIAIDELIKGMHADSDHPKEDERYKKLIHAIENA